MFLSLFKKISTATETAMGAIMLFLLALCSRLFKKTSVLERENDQKLKVIQKQKKLINVSKNTKPTDIVGNVRRMRKRKI